MSTAIRVRPDELAMVPLPEVDHTIIERLIGEERSDQMAQAGMAMADRTVITIDGLIAAVEAGICRSWVAYYDHRPAAFLMYAPFSLPGVWSGEVITAPDASDLRGVGTAAMALSLDLMFSEPAVRRIIGFVAVRNTQAVTLVERLGYIREGRCDRLLLAPDGTELDAWMVRMHREEWPGSAVFPLGGGRPDADR